MGMMVAAMTRTGMISKDDGDDATSWHGGDCTVDGRDDDAIHSGNV